MGLAFTIFISAVLPIGMLVYAIYYKRFFPFILGVITFVITQIIIRLPLLEYISANVSGFKFFSATKPILFAFLIGLSAALFEEIGRYIIMRLLMKQRDWLAGFAFGLGHGGIEALLLVGIPFISVIWLQAPVISEGMYFIAGIERLFTMILHIGLSIIVLRSVVTKRFMYLFLAIIIHTFIDVFEGLMQGFQMSGVWITEGVLIVVSVIVIIHSFKLRERSIL